MTNEHTSTERGTRQKIVLNAGAMPSFSPIPAVVCRIRDWSNGG